MTELFQQILQWVSLHPAWANAIIFTVAMAESLAVIGLIVPGVIIMFGIGALIAGGAIAFWPAFGWAVAGAVCGDGLSFWLGRRYRGRLKGLWPFNRHPAGLERGLAFFERYGGKSVAIGRFFGPVRAVIPLAAGMMGMRPSRFLVANILSALVWAPAYLLPGIVFGASVELASEVALRLVLLLVLLLALGWLTFHLIKWIFRLLHPHASAWVQGILRWSRLHPVMGEIAAALADTRHPEARGLSILASLLILGTLGFVLLTGVMLEGGAMGEVNTSLLQLMQSLRTPWADHLMVYLTRLTDTNTSIMLVLGVTGYLLWRGHRRTLLYWLAAVLFAAVAVPLLKMALHVPRPAVVSLPPDSYSFPSGHTLRAMVLYGFLSVLIARPVAINWRWLPYGVAGLMILGIGLSRLYLGVHWLSDVLGSITLGLAWVAALGMAYHRHTGIEIHWRSFSAALLLILAAAFTVESWLHHEHRMARYQSRDEISLQPEAQWWADRGSGLPASRIDVRHLLAHPLNIQFAGSLDGLRQALADAGWRRAESLGWMNILKLLSPGLPLHELPVLPQVHDGRHESLVLEKRLAEGGRLVLRLWPAQIHLTPGNTPLWLGAASGLKQVTIVNLVTYAATAEGDGTALAALRDTLADQSLLQFEEADGRLLIRDRH